MTYKCVFSDIDGTLLNSKHQISEKTKKKVQQLAIQNIPFVLVSARMPKGMHYFLDELQIKAPMVSDNFSDSKVCRSSSCFPNCIYITLSNSGCFI